MRRSADCRYDEREFSEVSIYESPGTHLSARKSCIINCKSFLSDFTQQRRYTFKSMTSDLDLLGQYVRKKSQDAFAEIVRRRVDLVYSAALRQVRSPQLAEEVAQSVFADLARKAGKISGTGVPPVNSLTPWLYAVTRRTAIDVIRKESRRQLREQIAVEMNNMNATESSTGVPPVWSEIEPFFDEAMESLDETDRSAILLRYFESKSVREVGEALGASEDAAQKRVSRAVERLREFFSKRKVTIGVSGLVVLISANAIQAAPVGLAQGIIATVSSLAGVSAASTFFSSVLGKVLVVGGATAVVFVGVGIYFHMAGQFATGKFQAGGNQGVLVDSNQNGSTDLKSASITSKVPANVSDDAKLDEAIAHLRKVLHTRPSTHQLYDYEQITNAIEEFGLYRRDAFNVLLESCSDSEEFVRAGAIAGMGYLGKYLPEASPILWSMIYTSPSRERWLIFRALQQIGFTPSDLPALTGLLTNGPISDGTYLTKIVPEAVAGLIEAHPQVAKPYLASVENLLDDSNPDIRFRATLALIKSEGTNNPKIFTSLHELFQRPNNRLSEYYKDIAAGILGDVGPTAQSLVPDLLEFAKSASEIGVQEAVYSAVAQIEPDLSLQNPDVAKALKQQEDAKMWEEKWKSGSYSFDDLRAALKDPNQALLAANHLAEMGTNAHAAVPDMIRALWGKDEDTRNKILEDIHKVDPQVVVTKVSMDSVSTGGLHEFLDKQPPTQKNKMLQQDVVTLELFSGWCLPEELADFTNKLAQQNQDAYKVFVEDNNPSGK